MNILSNGVQLQVTESGSGDIALVFMHFWGGSSETWTPVINLLNSHYRCIAIDARGSGASQAAAAGYRSEDHAADVYNVIQQLGLQRVILVGHSMGGKTMQFLASRRPKEVIGLALVASAPLAPMNIDEAQRQQMRGAYASRESILWTLDNVLTAGNLTPEQREKLVADALRVSAEAADGWLYTASQEDLRDVADRINVPVLIMAGELDKVDTVAVMEREIAARYPFAEVQIFPGKGHLLPVEASAEVAAGLRKFAVSLQH